MNRSTNRSLLEYRALRRERPEEVSSGGHIGSGHGYKAFWQEEEISLKFSNSVLNQKFSTLTNSGNSLSLYPDFLFLMSAMSRANN